MGSVRRSSELGTPANVVWSRAGTPDGINDELRPLLRMTTPPRLRGKTIDDVEPGVALGRSWILLGGVLPVDFDDLCLAEVEPGRRFAERSRTLAFASWRHERTVEPIPAGGCRVSDRLAFELRALPARIPGADRLARAVVGALFAHRHRRLAARYGLA